jgi:hypothetical protein
MNILDKIYPIHRAQLLKTFSKQALILELGLEENSYTGKKRGRKVSKINKNIELKPNYKTYA